VVVLVSTLCTPAFGAPREVVLRGSWAPYAVGHNLVRPARPNERVDFQLYLGLRDRSAAETLLASVSDPASPNYAHYLSPGQFRARFSPSQAEVDLARSWLLSAGFHVGAVPANRLVIPAWGTVRQAEAAFGVRLGYYRVHGRTLLAPASAPRIPGFLAGVVHGVLNLAESFVHPMLRTANTGPAPPPPVFRNARPCSAYWGEKVATTVPRAYDASPPYVPCGYTPEQMQGAYGIANAISSGHDGTGVTVAIIDAYASPTIQEDLDTYSARHGLPQLTLQQITLPPRRGSIRNQQGWYGEETLDVEAVHSMAPGASILYWGAASNSNADIRDAMIDIVDNHRAQIISNSYGNLGEQLPPHAMMADDDVYIQAGLEGIGVYFSSGDDGDEVSTLGYQTVDWPASSVHVTAVGGTSLGVGANDDYLFETGWGTAASALGPRGWRPAPPGVFLYGSGGGTSFVFDEPSWQQGVVPAFLSSAWGRTNRVVPDIALDGDPNTGFLVGETQTFPNGSVKYSEFRIGGTSLSCPLLAGIMAIADQMAGLAHGFANPALYSVAKSPAVRDVVNPPTRIAAVRVDYANFVNAKEGFITTLRTMNVTGRLQVGTGYDNVTGIGSPNGEAFLTALS